MDKPKKQTLMISTPDKMVKIGGKLQDALDHKVAAEPKMASLTVDTRDGLLTTAGEISSSWNTTS